MTPRLQVLGGLSLTIDGRAMTGAAGQRRSLALLAILAVHASTGVSREKLAMLLWPDNDDASSRNNLRQSLYQLRRELGAEAIRGTADLRLDPLVVPSDLTRFDDALAAGRLEDAVAAYAGPLLDGFHPGGDASEFESWIDVHRARYALACRTALDALAAAASSPEAALPWRQRLALFDPLDETIARTLIETLAAAGDRAGALRHAEAHRVRMLQELGVSPHASIVALVHTLKQEAPAAPLPLGSEPEAAGHARVDHIATDARHAADTPTAAERLPVRSDRTRRLRVGMSAAAASLLAAIVWWGARDTLGAAISPPRTFADGAVQVVFASTKGQGATSQEAFVATVSQLLQQDFDRSTLPRQDRTPPNGWLVKVVADSAAALAAGVGTPDTPARPRYFVQLARTVSQDSVWWVAEVLDRQHGDAPMSPARVSAALTDSVMAATRLAERVAVVLAAQSDPRFATWAAYASLPATWRGFEALRAGIASWAGEPPVRADLSLFVKAEQADSSAATAVVWRALIMSRTGRQPASTQLLDSLARSSRRQAPWDAALVRVLQAWNRGDVAAAHDAGHALLRVVPHSEWAILVAWDAMTLGRHAEALELLEPVVLRNDWTRTLANEVRFQAFHLTGRFADELRIAEEGLRRHPDSRWFPQIAVRALAGLGRVQDVERTCLDALTIAPRPGGQTQPCWQAVLELVGHGHLAAARTLGLRVVAHESVSGANDTAKVIDVTSTLQLVGDWRGADSTIVDIPQWARGSMYYLETLLEQQAWRRDRNGVRDTKAALDHLRRAQQGDSVKPDFYKEASVAALLGDKDEAVDWLVRGFREGYRFRTGLHFNSAFIPLHGYAPYEALLVPKDDPAHRKAMRLELPR